MEDYSEEKINTNEIDLNANLDEYEDFWGDDTAGLVPVNFDPSVLDDVPEMKNAPGLANAPKVTKTSTLGKAIQYEDWMKKEKQKDDENKRLKEAEEKAKEEAALAHDEKKKKAEDAVPRLDYIGAREAEEAKIEKKKRRLERNRCSAVRHRKRKKTYVDEAFKYMQDLESKIEYYEYVLKEKKLETYIHLDEKIITHLPPL